ncbi:MAG: tetratricopeptide repeat protein [Vampirovibrionales bacterium]|nr:tetratricopeptide repeat protein [Vampirovibrionales bacterium]
MRLLRRHARRRLLGSAAAMLLIGAGFCASARAAGVIQMENNLLLHADRGKQMLTFERWEEAAAEFRLALQLNPYSPMAPALYHNLSVAYRRMRSFSLAIASAQRAILLTPMFEQYYRGLIDAYQAAGFLTLAQEKLRRIVAVNDRDAEAWYLLGLACQRNGRPDQAKEAFSRFVALAPHSRLAEALRAGAITPPGR